MGTIAKYAQNPDEVKRYTVSWVDWLDVNELIIAVEFEVAITNGSGSMLVVSSQAISTDGLTVSFLLSGGSANVTYKVTIRVDTSSSQIKEDSILLVVRND